MSGDRHVRIGSAIFNADHGRLAEAVAELDQAGIDFFHWDVFDGHFIPDLGFPPRTLASVRSLTDAPFEVHLGVVDIKRFIAPLADAGADLIFAPAESAPLLFEAVSWVRQAGVGVGVSIAVGTSIRCIEEVLPYVDSVLVLGRVYGESVGAKRFLPEAIAKVESLRSLLDRRGLEVGIEAAGTLRADTAKQVLAVGAGSVVFGSGLHKSDSLTDRLQELRRTLICESAP